MKLQISIITIFNIYSCNIFQFKDKGPHIYQTCPSANFFDCKAMAIGARSQSARTYLEKHLDEFLDSKYLLQCFSKKKLQLRFIEIHFQCIEVKYSAAL